MLSHSHSLGKLEVTLEDFVGVLVLKVQDITVGDEDEDYRPYTLTIENREIGEALTECFSKSRCDWNEVIRLLKKYNQESCDLIKMLEEQLGNLNKTAPEIFKPIDLPSQNTSLSESCSIFFAKGLFFFKSLNCCNPQLENDEFNDVRFTLIGSDSDEELPYKELQTLGH